MDGFDCETKENAEGEQEVDESNCSFNSVIESSESPTEWDGEKFGVGVKASGDNWYDGIVSWQQLALMMVVLNDYLIV